MAGKMPPQFKAKAKGKGKDGDKKDAKGKDEKSLPPWLKKGK